MLVIIVTRIQSNWKPQILWLLLETGHKENLPVRTHGLMTPVVCPITLYSLKVLSIHLLLCFDGRKLGKAPQRNTASKLTGQGF